MKKHSNTQPTISKKRQRYLNEISSNALRKVLEDDKDPSITPVKLSKERQRYLKRLSSDALKAVMAQLLTLLRKQVRLQFQIRYGVGSCV